MKTNKVIGVGIIGASEGSWAVKSHLPALKKLSNQFRITAVSTSNLKSAKTTANLFGVTHAFDNEHDLVNQPDVDIVVVAVKVPAHFGLVSAALNAGKMVFCEWPLGNGLEEARQLENLARKKDIKTFCGLQSGSLPELRFIKDWLAAGHLGNILSTSIIGGGNNWGTVLASESLSYLLDPKNGATMLHIPFAHLLDGLQFSLGQVTDFTALLARRNHEVVVAGSDQRIPQLANDQIVLTGTLSDGTLANIHYHGGEWDGVNLQWEIYGSKGKLVITSPTGHLQFGKLKLEVAFNGKPTEMLTTPDSYCPSKGGTPGFDAEPSRGLFYAYQQIFEDIREGTSHFPDFSYAVRHHELITAIEATS